MDITRKHADWLIQNKSYEHALAFDQLRNAMREGKTFRNFEEAPIDFPPTYKFDILKVVASREAEVHDESSFVTSDDSFGSPQSRPSLWRRMWGRPSRGPADATERNQASLVRMPSSESLSNVSESSSIMEEAAGGLHHKTSAKNLTAATTELPMEDRLAASLRQQALLRKSTNASTHSLGNGTYDSSSKQRVPSWCDRVLWRTNRPSNVQSKRRSAILRWGPELGGRGGEEESGSRYFKHSPLAWLHGRGQDHDAVEASLGSGSVHVLDYRSIDDMDAEKLGVTSDHRPVIFSAYLRV